MSLGTLSLAGASFLNDPAVRRVFDALSAAGEETRIVGGAVRDALMGRDVGDIDFATTLDPQSVARRAGEAGIKVVPTGIEHGTVTLVIDSRGFEVTTLREDVETDGRHAIVRFGRDWEADARRRDFTMNAFSVAPDGMVHDPVGGMADLRAGRVRFIGEAERRIAEDRLRILRFFRFHAQLGAGPLDPEGLSASIRGRFGLTDLSAERIGQEMRKLVVAAGAAETSAAMQDGGILPVVLAGIGYPTALARVGAIEGAARIQPTVALHLAALGCRTDDDVPRLTDRLRLSNAEALAIMGAVRAARGLARRGEERDDRFALYRLGERTFSDAMALAFAWKGPTAPDTGWLSRIGLPAQWSAPGFPMSGRDVIAAGVAHGPDVGAILKTLEEWWIAEDFRPDRVALEARLKDIVSR